VSFSLLLSKPEFWSALFGALAAFLLGALGAWWAANSAKRTAGNLALVALSQMYSQTENVRYYFLVAEPIRARGTTGHDPLPYEIRGAIGLVKQNIRVPAESLGFLADSHDPDVLNRLLTIEREFTSLMDLVRRHERLHDDFTAVLDKRDPSGQEGYRPQDFLRTVGIKVLIQIDDTIEGLRTGLPECRDDILAIGEQLREVLRSHLPARKFIRFSAAPRSRLSSQPPDLPKPALWRRATRAIVDILRTPLRWNGGADAASKSDLKLEPQAPEIKRFPPRS
jgi:hypothetical protein